MKAAHLVAHRGYPKLKTENTMQSIQAAVDAGAQYVEVDIQLTSDKQPVLFHDRDLLRLADCEKPVHELDWPALQKIELLQSLRIPHFSELIEFIQTTEKIVFFIEIKRISVENFGATIVVEQIIKYLEQVKHQSVIISYSLEALTLVRQKSTLPIGVVVDDWQESNLPTVTKLEAEYLFCRLQSLPVGDVPKSGKTRLAVFETEDPDIAVDLLHRGVDLVETFSIGEMIKATTL